MDFLREFGMSDDIKYNFNAKINEFKKIYPDVSVYRQHEIRPCPYNFMYENSDGKRFAEFFYEYADAKKRWEALKNNNDGSMTIFGLDYLEVNRGIYYPVQPKS